MLKFLAYLIFLIQLSNQLDCKVACPQIVDWVCATSGRSYQNLCQLICVGKEVFLSNGRCPNPSSMIAKTKSVSLTTDCICLAVYQPVCGVNGIKYGNICEAGCAGIKIKYERV